MLFEVMNEKLIIAVNINKIIQQHYCNSAVSVLDYFIVHNYLKKNRCCKKNNSHKKTDCTEQKI